MDGVFIGNKVAGSVENAFAIIQTYFIQQTIDLQYPVDLCNVTFSTRMNATDIDKLTMVVASARRVSNVDGIRSKAMRMNEAVASSVGLTVVALTAHDVDIYEAANLNCGFIHNFKLWRNDHVGVLAMDLSTELVIFQTVMAENTIGVSLNIYSPHKYDFFVGVIMSKVIGIIGSDHFDTTTLDSSKTSQTDECQSLTDTKWPDKYSDTRQNILAAFSYSRVGLMTPQFLNAPQTCTFLHGRACRVPYAIRDSCMMPFEKRYGLPVSLQYTETHIYGNLFAGFCRRYNNTKSSDIIGTKSAVAVYKSVAISLNPSQIDRFSTLVLSHNRFIVNNCINRTVCRTNTTFSPVSYAMTAFDIFAFRDAAKAYSRTVCEGSDCLHRSPQAVLVDLDGSTLKAFELLNDTASSLLDLFNSTSLMSGQIVFNDGQSFEAPTRRCRLLTGPDHLLDLFTYCPANQLTDDYLQLVLSGNLVRYSSDSNSGNSGGLLNVSILNSITVNNTLTSITNATITPYEPFAVYKAQWDDRNPTIYPFFRVLAHPANANLLTLPVTANVTGRIAKSISSGSVGFYQGRPVYDFYDNGERQVIMSDDESCCHSQHRHFQTSSFQYVSFAPVYEECSAKILYNRNKLDFADGYVHYLYLLGHTPFEFVLRWNAPSVNNSAIIKIVFQYSFRFGYNVFVCDFPFIDNNVEEMKVKGKSCTYVPSLTNPIQDIHNPYVAKDNSSDSSRRRHASLTNEAGTNHRDFDKSTLSLVLRGGSENRFYTVRKVPMLFLAFEVTFEIAGNSDDVGDNNHWSKILQGKALLATLLELDTNVQLMVSSVAQLTQLTSYSDGTYGGIFGNQPSSSSLSATVSTSSSVSSLSSGVLFTNASNITQVVYAITPSAALYAGDRSLQVSELTAIYKNMSEDFLPTGLFQSLWLNVTVLQAFARIPVVAETIDEVAVDDLRLHVPSFDVDALRMNKTTHNIGLTSFMKVSTAVINTPSNNPTPQAPSLFIHYHHQYLESAYIAFAMLLTATVIFTALVLYRYHRYRQQQLSTLATYADFDVFVLLARFHVKEFDELIRDFTDGIEKVIDILFTPDMGSTSNCIQSSLIKRPQQLPTPETITEIALMIMALVKKSVVLDTLNVERLLTIIRTKSKQCREHQQLKQTTDLRFAESYKAKTNFASFGCFSASAVIPHDGHLHSIHESNECHSINRDGWQRPQQASLRVNHVNIVCDNTATLEESTVEDSHTEPQQEQEKERASLLKVCESKCLPQLKLIVSLLYSHYKHKLRQLQEKITFTSTARTPGRRWRSDLKESLIVSTSLATDATTLRSQLNLIHATVTTLIANNRFLDNSQADSVIIFELRWYNKIILQFEKMFGKTSSDSKTINRFVSRLRKHLFIPSKRNSTSSGVEKNQIASPTDTTIVFDIESAFTNEYDNENNGAHKTDGIDDMVTLNPSSPIRPYQPYTTSPIITISSSSINNHSIVSISPGHDTNNRPVSRQLEGLQNVTSQRIEGGNRSTSRVVPPDFYSVKKVVNRPPALAIIPRRVVETERHNQLLLALTNTPSSTAELPYQSYMSLGMSLRPLSRSVDEDGGNSESIFSDSDPAGSEYDLSSQPPHQLSSASNKKSLGSMSIHSQTLKSSSLSQQMQNRSKQELDKQLLTEYNFNNDKPDDDDDDDDDDDIIDDHDDSTSDSDNS